MKVSVLFPTFFVKTKPPLALFDVGWVATADPSYDTNISS